MTTPDRTERLTGKLGLDSAARRQRLQFLDLTGRDEAALRRLQIPMRESVDEILDELYAHILQFDEVRQLLGDEENVRRVKDLQRGYFLRLWDGNFDQRYVESRLQVGKTHERIGLDTQWYLGTYCYYVNLILSRITQTYSNDPDKLLAALTAVNKVLFFDMTLAVETYIDALSEVVTKQQRALHIIDGPSPYPGAKGRPERQTG